MEKYRLLCKKENEEILRELFKANRIVLDREAPVILCEQGMECRTEYDLMIYFRPDRITALLRLIKNEHQQQLSILMGKSDEDYIPVEISNIVYFNAYDNDTYANTADGKRYKIKNKLYELEEGILPKRFIRINKSEIVNIRFIDKITPLFKGKLILKMYGYKEPVDISRNYIKEFKERIGM
jgi:two-component system LytT family response regulator